jgi:hypothetical protein
MIHQSAPRVHQSIKYRSATGERVSDAKASAAMWSSGRRWTGHGASGGRTAIERDQNMTQLKTESNTLRQLIHQT